MWRRGWGGGEAVAFCPSPLVGEGGSAARAQRETPRRMRGVGRVATLPRLRAWRVNLHVQVTASAPAMVVDIRPETSASAGDACQRRHSANTSHPTAPTLRYGAATFSHKGRRQAARASPPSTDVADWQGAG